MVVICGNSRLMARAAQIVLTCRPFSGATPAGSAKVKLWAAGGASAVNDFISAALATRSGGACATGGAGSGDGCWCATGLALGAAATGFTSQHGVSVLCA